MPSAVEIRLHRVLVNTGVCTRGEGPFLRPPDDNPYTSFKEIQSALQLQNNVSSSRCSGDREPIQLLRQMLGDCPELDLSFRSCFSLRLPHNERMVLTFIPDTTTFDKLAEMEGKITEIAIPPVAAIATQPPICPPRSWQLRHLCAGVTLRKNSSRLAPPQVW